MGNGCEGCIMYNPNFDLKFDCELAVNPHASKTKQCPCLTCLVKMRCRSECEKFRKYAFYVDTGREK